MTEAWAAAVSQRRIRLVVIEGATGIGKTAVVRALYEQLAMLQARPAYWPATLDSPTPPGDRRRSQEANRLPGEPGNESVESGAVWRQARANRIYPVEMAPTIGARPGYFWWGLTGSAGAFAALAGDPQIKRHVAGIADAVARGDRMTRDRLVLAAKTAGVVTSLGLLGPVLAGLAASVDISRNAIDLVRSVPEVTQSRDGLIGAALRRMSGTVFSVTARPQAWAGAEEDARLLALVGRMLPLLIAVKSAQSLDPVTIRLLRVLSRQSGAGLIVLMVDTDQPGNKNVDVSRGDTLGEWLRSEEREQRLTRIRLSPLSAAELTELAVGELGTGLDAVTLARIVDHSAGVPGILYELMDAPAVAAALRHGGPGPADLATVPELAGVRAALAAAPEPMRRVLAVASVHGSVTLREWLTSQSSSLAEPTAAEHSEIAAGTIDEATTSGWLRQRPGTPIIEFTSPHVLQVSRAAQSRELTPAAIRAVRQALVATIVTAHADRTWDDLDEDVRESLLASVVEQDAGAFSGAVRGDLAAELFTLRQATGRDATSREFLASVAERLASRQAPPGVLTVATAEALFDAGQHDQAFQLLRQEHTRLKREYGEGDTRTLSALHNLAAASAAAADAVRGRPEALPLYQTALALYENLLGLRERMLPAAREFVISTREQYARLLAACYLYQEALNQGEVLLHERRTALGSNHLDTLITRRDLATWRGEMGNPEAAAAELKVLLADMVPVLGRGHPNTLATRGNLASWRGEAGEPAAAAAAYEKLLPEMTQALGHDHPMTLTTRSNIAEWRARAGSSASATVAAFKKLLADQLRVLGPDDLGTLTTRSLLAEWRGEAGHPATAAAAFKELLADELRLLGPDDAKTLATRAELANSRAHAGDLTGAIAAYEELLTDELRVLGRDHTLTLSTRHNLAGWRGKAGDVRAAIAAYEELLTDELRVLGPDHPTTLNTQRNLARWRARVGNPAVSGRSRGNARRPAAGPPRRRKR